MEKCLECIYIICTFAPVNKFRWKEKRAFRPPLAPPRSAMPLATEGTQEIAETTEWTALQKVVNQTFTKVLEYENEK